DVGMAHREAANVGLVDDRLGPRRRRGSVVAPVEVVVGHHPGQPSPSRVTARAYGSTSSRSGSKRLPCAGSYGPPTRSPYLEPGCNRSSSPCQTPLVHSVSETRCSAPPGSSPHSMTEVACGAHTA